MAKREISTCTQDGMTQAQPGTSVSVGHLHGSGVYTLSVSRFYPTLKNSFGGRGVFKKLDCDGMEFATNEAAWAFAFEHGYTRLCFISASSRARNIENGATRKAQIMEVRARLASGKPF